MLCTSLFPFSSFDHCTERSFHYYKPRAYTRSTHYSIIITMKTFALVSVLIAAATALPSPFPAFELERSVVARDDSNCTQYCSVSAGCVCTVRPSDCTALYTVQSGDTCTAIAESFGNFTVSQLYQWNPDVGRSCFG